MAAVIHFNLESIAVGVDRRQIELLKHIGAKALVAAGHVADGQAQQRARIPAPAAADHLAQPRPVFDAAARHVARAQRHVGGALGNGQQHRQVVRLVREIGVHFAQVAVALAQAFAETGDIGGAQAQLAAAAHELHTRGVRSQRRHHVAGAVGRTVVHHQHIELRALLKHGGDQARDVLGLVVGWHHHQAVALRFVRRGWFGGCFVVVGRQCCHVFSS